MFISIPVVTTGLDVATATGVLAALIASAIAIGQVLPVLRQTSACWIPSSDLYI